MSAPLPWLTAGTAGAAGASSRTRVRSGWAWAISDTLWCCGGLQSPSMEAAELVAVARLLESHDPEVNVTVQVSSLEALRALTETSWLGSDVQVPHQAVREHIHTLIGERIGRVRFTSATEDANDPHSVNAAALRHADSVLRARATTSHLRRDPATPTGAESVVGPWVVVGVSGQTIKAPKQSAGPAGWAWYVSATNWGAGGVAHVPRAYAELVAVAQALVAVPRELNVELQTSSELVVEVLSAELGPDAPDEWTNAAGKPVAGQDQIRRCLELVRKRSGGLRVVDLSKGQRQGVAAAAEECAGHAAAAVRSGHRAHTQPQGSVCTTTQDPATVVELPTPRATVDVPALRAVSPANMPGRRPAAGRSVVVESNVVLRAAVRTEDYPRWFPSAAHCPAGVDDEDLDDPDLDPEALWRPHDAQDPSFTASTPPKPGVHLRRSVPAPGRAPAPDATPKAATPEGGTGEEIACVVCGRPQATVNTATVHAVTAHTDVDLAVSARRWYQEALREQRRADELMDKLTGRPVLQAPCRKVGYPTAAAAGRALLASRAARLHKGTVLHLEGRYYQCYRCLYWHLTSQAERTT